VLFDLDAIDGEAPQVKPRADALTPRRNIHSRGSAQLDLHTPRLGVNHESRPGKRARPQLEPDGPSPSIPGPGHASNERRQEILERYSGSKLHARIGVSPPRLHRRHGDRRKLRSAPGPRVEGVFVATLALGLGLAVDRA
jgi:hypothetical protein